MGIKLGVSPKLISERLLSEEDKKDMLNGMLPEDALEAHISVWMENGMPDYNNGKTLPYEQEKRLKKDINNQTYEKSKIEYRRPFIDYRHSKD